MKVGKVKQQICLVSKCGGTRRMQKEGQKWLQSNTPTPAADSQRKDIKSLKRNLTIQQEIADTSVRTETSAETEIVKRIQYVIIKNQTKILR